MTMQGVHNAVSKKLPICHVISFLKNLCVPVCVYVWVYKVVCFTQQQMITTKDDLSVGNVDVS